VEPPQLGDHPASFDAARLLQDRRAEAMTMTFLKSEVLKMICCGAFAVGVAIGSSSAAHAGRFELHEGNSGGQDVVGTLRDDLTVTTVSGSSTFVNDEARSVIAYWVAPGTVLRLYDSPSCSTSDDWVSIKVKTLKKKLVISSFQQSVSGPDYEVAYHAVNGLDGKVSCAKVTAVAPPATYTIAEHWIYDQIEDAFVHFPAKYGQAMEYSVGDHQYRIYRPTITKLTGGGWSFAAKMNHIRGLTEDDVGVIRLELDASGRITKTDTVIELGSLFGGTQALIESWAAGSGGPDTTTPPSQSLAQRLTQVSLALIDDLSDLTESGGRLLFPDELRDHMETIGLIAIDVIEQL
jgi:hypothetical protein